jgi:hypothetical protein
MCEDRLICIDANLSFRLRCDQTDGIPFESDIRAFVNVFWSAYADQVSRLIGTNTTIRLPESWPTLRIAIVTRGFRNDIIVVMQPVEASEGAEFTYDVLNGYDNDGDPMEDCSELWDVLGHQL